jgi:hypothetical protein
MMLRSEFETFIKTEIKLILTHISNKFFEIVGWLSAQKWLIISLKHLDDFYDFYDFYESWKEIFIFYNIFEKNKHNLLDLIKHQNKISSF